MLERDLYEPVYNYLEVRFRDRLKPPRGDLRHITAITANTGGNATGLWSKPDLCLISLSRQKYRLTWNLDLHGFEVKPTDCCDVQSVHEALNHSPSSILLILFGKLSAGMSETTSAQRLSPGVLTTGWD
jgi:hypothetical protein